MAQRSGRSILQRFEALPIIVVFVLLLLLFIYMAPEVFLAPYIYTTFLSTLPPLILLATGLTFVIGAGEIDLSFPSIIAFSGFIFSVLFKEYDLGWIAVIAALASGVLVGFLNGVIIAKIGIPSFMTTLGTQFFSGGRVAVSRAPTVFDEAGNLKDAAVQDQLKSFLAAYVAFVRRAAP